MEIISQISAWKRKKRSNQKIQLNVIPAKAGIQEMLNNNGYTLKGTMAGLRRYDKIDALKSLAKIFIYN